MKWLLVTATANPGDSFVRMGTERLIQAADPSAIFCRWDKESGQLPPRECDRAVVCGMPLFWSHPDGDACWRMTWWEQLQRIARRIPLLALGVGGVAGVDGALGDAKRLHAEARAFGALARVYPRDPSINRICGMDWETVPCPSVFALDPASRPKLKLCNLMPGGGHWPKYGPREAAAFGNLVRPLAGELIRRGFTFIAHHQSEQAFAHSMDFPGIVRERDPAALLEHYSRCTCYVGNRVHGALPAIGAGGRALCIGYDSRIETVRHVGGEAWLPSATTVARLGAWIDAGAMPAFDREAERERMVRLII